MLRRQFTWATLAGALFISTTSTPTPIARSISFCAGPSFLSRTCDNDLVLSGVPYDWWKQLFR